MISFVQHIRLKNNNYDTFKLSVKHPLYKNAEFYLNIR